MREYKQDDYKNTFTHLFVYLSSKPYLKGFLTVKISIMTIAERIRLIRQQKGLSQKELAEKALVNLKSLSRYELGSSVPPADILKQISDALGVTSDMLLGDEETKIRDKDLMRKMEVIQQLEPKEKNVVYTFLDMVIRDHKAKQAYAS